LRTSSLILGLLMAVGCATKPPPYVPPPIPELVQDGNVLVLPPGTLILRPNLPPFTCETNWMAWRREVSETILERAQR